MKHYRRTEIYANYGMDSAGRNPVYTSAPAGGVAYEQLQVLIPECGITEGKLVLNNREYAMDEVLHSDPSGQPVLRWVEDGKEQCRQLLMVDKTYLFVLKDVSVTYCRIVSVRPWVAQQFGKDTKSKLEDIAAEYLVSERDMTVDEFAARRIFEVAKEPVHPCYYTFGSDPGFPYQNTYLIVFARDCVDADDKFRLYYPDRSPGCLNCSFSYSDKQWKADWNEPNRRTYWKQKPAEMIF